MVTMTVYIYVLASYSYFLYRRQNTPPLVYLCIYGIDLSVKNQYILKYYKNTQKAVIKSLKT